MPSNLPSLVKHQRRLAARPVGLPTPADWHFTGEPVAAPADDGVGVQVQPLSNPAMRGWMKEGQRYIPPVGVGEAMRAGGVGTVVASRHPGFAVGAAVSGIPGVQQFWSVTGDAIQRDALRKVELVLALV